MTVSIVECSRCQGRFNFEWSWGASASSIKFGNRCIFKCPICKELNSFSLAHKGRDPTLPTYNEMQVGAGRKTMGLLLGPLLVLIAIGVILLATTVSSPYYPLSVLPIVAGFAWLAAYVRYLYRRLGRRSGNASTDEAHVGRGELGQSTHSTPRSPEIERRGP